MDENLEEMLENQPPRRCGGVLPKLFCRSNEADRDIRPRTEEGLLDRGGSGCPPCKPYIGKVAEDAGLAARGGLGLESGTYRGRALAGDEERYILSIRAWSVPILHKIIRSHE